MVRSTLALAALATCALVLTSAPDSGAATVLTTALAPTFNGQSLACFITNIDKKPITVALQVINAVTGMPQTPVTNGCPVPPATLPPGISCEAILTANSIVYCVVTTSSATARASLDVFNGTTAALEVHIPATK